MIRNTDWHLPSGPGMLGVRIALALACNMVAPRVNTHFTLVSEMPHGGQKQSGYGKDMSVYGLEDYTIVRHVMIKHE